MAIVRWYPQIHFLMPWPIFLFVVDLTDGNRSLHLSRQQLGYFCNDDLKSDC